MATLKRRNFIFELHYDFQISPRKRTEKAYSEHSLSKGVPIFPVVGEGP